MSSYHLAQLTVQTTLSALRSSYWVSCQGESRYQATRVHHAPRRRGGLAACGPGTAGERARRIGFLRAAPPPEHELDAFLPALAERGYVQGRNFVLVPQWGDGNVARLSELAVTLVNQGVDVIVIEGTIVVRAAAAVTASIPIVTAIRRRPFFLVV
jgi:hypothetical protein